MATRYTPYGLWLRNELASLGMNQVELADLTGIGRRTISDIMIGRNKKEEHKAKIEAVLAEKGQNDRSRNSRHA